MKINCGRLYSQSMGTHAQPQTSVLSLSPSLPHSPDGFPRLYASTSSMLLKHKSALAHHPENFRRLCVYTRFGWFWECPNGGEKCQYRHALPPGFVLKSQRKALEDAEKANTISLEEFLEVEVDIQFFSRYPVIWVLIIHFSVIDWVQILHR